MPVIATAATTISASSAIRASTSIPACAELPSVFLHELLEDPAAPGSTDGRRHQATLVARAERLCLDCPLMTRCLFDAVVKYDVSGFVAGTTARQRTEMRRLLGVRVEPEDLDTLAGVTTANRQVDHDEVLRLRNANPHESLETIAHRLGCSLSTVKRHLRRARAAREVPAPRLHQVAPSLEQVMAAYRTVVSARQRGSRAA